LLTRRHNETKMNIRKPTTNEVLVSLLMLGGLGLLMGLYSGLVRLGLGYNSAVSISPLAHGPLMINGFLGTVIGLERAAALEDKWAYSAPLLLGFSTLLLLSDFMLWTQLLMIAGSAVLMMVMINLYRQHPQHYHLIMALGAVSLFTGNLLFIMDFAITHFVVWWLAFPLLTIFGERLELNRIMRPPHRAQIIFLILIILWVGSLAGTHFYRQGSWLLASLLLIAIAIWLFYYDVAQKTIKASAWTRYSAISLLTGYGWLVLSGISGIVYGFSEAGPVYDAQLHMMFVGFVFSMIFAHASVIIPSLSGKTIFYHYSFYLPLILLHGMLLVRMVGDLGFMPYVRKVGSYGNVIAILLFFLGVIFNFNAAHGSISQRFGSHQN